MIYFLIGHRGVGKSSLLKRIKKYYQFKNNNEYHFYDLDLEIEKKYQKTIPIIFKEYGEKKFRLYEKKTLEKILGREEKKEMKAFIALGAGYEGELPKKGVIIWVCRDTDLKGRVFLDRPFLKKELSPIEEFSFFYKEREKKYQNLAHQTWLMREGLTEKSWDQGEYQFFTASFTERSGLYTAQGKKNESLLPWERLELRDDILSQKEIELIKKKIPAEKLLISQRKNEGEIINDVSYQYDQALELLQESSKAQIISVHDYKEDENLEGLLKRLEIKGKKGQILKAAPFIKNFSELWIGHCWQQKNPRKRAFLPRSDDGRWQWYRLFMKGKMPLNFWRTGRGLLDQPSLAQWLNHLPQRSFFAAVLGSDISSSHTPIEQEDFFTEFLMPVYGISIKPSEWKLALEVLVALGLKAAAITAPFKKKAFEYGDHKTKMGSELQSINTLYWHQGQSWGTNTDIAGLQKVKESFTPEKIAIWGGGGVLSSLKKVFPKALSYSARTGKRREVNACENEKPEVIIWASGRHESYQFPPASWPVKKVIDLSYSEDSMGKELALKRKCQYISGELMFKEQAYKQREFWLGFLKKDNDGKK